MAQQIEDLAAFVAATRYDDVPAAVLGHTKPVLLDTPGVIFAGTARHNDEPARLLADFGDRHIMVLRNHGLLIVGTSVAETFVATSRMERACATQLAFQQSGAMFNPIAGDVVTTAHQKSKAVGDRAAQFEWAALLRALDRIDPSYKN